MTHKVMLVDDDRTLTGLLKTLLELDGFDVAVVAQVAQVPTQIQTQHPDVIVMDVHLADGDGLTLLRQLRADPPTQALPIIMASGMDLEDQCKDAGATAFVLKPYPPDQLTETIQK
ncbi:MAG: response regulator, partial [Anaerolineales bacterium]|nr:response regulator [Anaerolineales bacterium]